MGSFANEVDEGDGIGVGVGAGAGMFGGVFDSGLTNEGEDGGGEANGKEGVGVRLGNVDG